MMDGCGTSRKFTTLAWRAVATSALEPIQQRPSPANQLDRNAQEIGVTHAKKSNGGGSLFPVNGGVVCTRYACWSGGNSGCNGSDAGGRGKYRRVEKCGAESGSRPDQRSHTREFQLQQQPRRPHPECSEHSAGDSDQRIEELESDRPLDYPDHLPTASDTAVVRTTLANYRRIWAGRHEPYIFHLAEKEQGDLGRRPDVGIPHGNQYDLSGTGKIQRGPLGGCASTAQAMDDWVSCKQRVVFRRSFRSRQASSEPVPPPVVRELQHEEGLVPHHFARYHRQLESAGRRRLDSALRRRSGKNHEARISTGEHHRTVLRKRSPSAGSFAVGSALTVCVVVPEAHQRAGKRVAGAKTKADE